MKFIIEYLFRILIKVFVVGKPYAVPFVVGIIGLACIVKVAELIGSRRSGRPMKV